MLATALALHGSREPAGGLQLHRGGLGKRFGDHPGLQEGQPGQAQQQEDQGMKKSFDQTGKAAMASGLELTV